MTIGQYQVGQPLPPLNPITKPDGSEFVGDDMQTLQPNYGGYDPNTAITGTLAIPGGNTPGVAQGGAQPGGPQAANPWGGIQRPTPFQTFDPNTGVMKRQFQVDPNQVNSMSQWGQMLQQQLKGQYGASKGDIAAQALSGTQSGWNRLARQGGMTGGGRMALAKAGSRDATAGLQNLAAQYQQQQSQVGQQDYGRQIGVQERNIDRNLGQIAMQDQFNMETYQEQMQRAASEHMANVMGSGDGGGGKSQAQQYQDFSTTMDPIFGGKFDPTNDENVYKKILSGNK